MAQLDLHYDSLNARVKQLHTELYSFTQKLTDEFYDNLLNVYVPQLREDIQEAVPEDTGVLAASIVVRPRRLKYGSNVYVYASAMNKDFDYAPIQHENLDYQHSKGDNHYIEFPFLQMIEDIVQTENFGESVDFSNYSAPDRE